MKYGFIFDKETLANKLFELSNEEVALIQCIINGGHNVCLRGYKPERIVNAIKAIVGQDCHIEEPDNDITLEDFCGGGPELKKGVVSLANEGFLIMKNVDTFRTSVIEMCYVPLETGNIKLSRAGRCVTYPSKFQLIATLSENNLHPSILDSLLSKCEIDYYAHAEANRVVTRVDFLQYRVINGWNNHVSILHTNVKNHDGNYESEDCFTSEGWNMYKIRMLPNYKNPGNIARVARTVADMNFHTVIRCSDLETAEKLYTPQFEYPY